MKPSVDGNVTHSLSDQRLHIHFIFKYFNFVLLLMILICQFEKQELSLISRLKVTNLLKTNNFVLPINISCVGCVAMMDKENILYT